MITVANLSINFGHKVLFENVSLKFDKGKRYGLVGSNGSGKTTFLKILAGDVAAGDGQVVIPQGLKVGVLRQNHFEYEDSMILDVVLQGNPVLWSALQEKEVLLQHPELDHEGGHRLGHLEEIIFEQNGYVAESFGAELLSGLGIREEYHRRPMRALSGGFKLRVLLAQTLFQEPELLLLDEPTNHLDILSIQWLEQFLINQYKGMLIFISHDQSFLNSVSTHIVDIDYETMILYHGNYDYFMEAKALAMEQRLKEIASQERKIADMQSFVDRFKAKATKARQAQSRIKQIEKIEIPPIKRSSRVMPVLKFEQKRPSGKTVLEIKHINKKFGDVSVLKDISFTVMKGEKIAIIGPNGIGKSTLLKIILDEIKPDHGQFQWGYETWCSYFAQDHHEQLNTQMNVYEWLYQTAPQETIGTIRGTLGKVLFSGDDAIKSIQALSGGEAARLLFAKMMLEKSNVLILDEPTNHMDLEGVEALEDALVEYPGTLLFVSHDRHFVTALATRIIELTPTGAIDFNGSYTEYLARQGKDYLNRQNPISTTQSSKPKTSAGSALSHEERKELKKESVRINKQLDKFSGIIETLEKEIKQLEDIFSDVNFYQNSSLEDVEKINKTKTRLENKLEEQMLEWESLMKAREALDEKLGIEGDVAS
ncbi:MAG: ATP-binding cassette domain-containing protein [SAR324 cluster bacterium]|nr:ATP-binding cassette domain-containing protein [SAR324 cluster bacterium]